MTLTLQKLHHRLPELLAAAIRDQHILTDVITCPASFDLTAKPPPPDSPEWRSLQPGDLWGTHPDPTRATNPTTLRWGIPTNGGSVHWLAAKLTVPVTWRSQQVLLGLDWQQGTEQASPEALIYLDNHEFAALDREHPTVLLPANSYDNEHHLLLRCYLPAPQPFGGLKLCLREPVVFQLGHLFRTLLATATALAPHTPARHQFIQLLNSTYNSLDLQAGWQSEQFVATAYNAIGRLLDELANLPPIPQQPVLIATGHAHLDIAWLWSLWRTRQKAVQTVATALHLMERYPNYHFSMSQPQLFRLIKQDAPALYERLQQRVAEGRFEPVGVMWLEADTILPSGESLVRQLIHGARFHEQEFGHISEVAWLLDSFGFNPALPQLLRGCGIKGLVTTKLSWNQTNRLPADTFRWRGIDGSDVLVHQVSAPYEPHQPTPTATPLEYTYTGTMEPAQIAATWANYRQQDLNQTLLYIYGWGDGGGGPTEEMLETARLFEQTPALPNLLQGRVDQFFQQIFACLWDSPDLPTWVGELYLEYHRGTYTTQARTKQRNRVVEQLYREAEWLNAWAVALGAPNQQARLDEGWEQILLNQFHDILPGSSIAQVYADSTVAYQRAAAIGRRVSETAQDEILARQFQELLSTEEGAEWQELFLVFNSLPWERQDTLLLTLDTNGQSPIFADQHGAVPITQLVEESADSRSFLVDITVPSYGYTTLVQENPTERSEGPALTRPLTLSPQLPITVDERTLTNPALRLELDQNGEIVSLYDREFERELISPDQTANQLVAYEDRPLEWDAWDIDPFYLEKPYPVYEIVDWQVIEKGPIRATIEITRQLGNSTIQQQISLWHNKRRIDFTTNVRWHEQHTLLRALFPFQINTTRATCEVQFGVIERPTHQNTSWDAARFEVPAHRWADLSEGGYGVALLNDGKYGYSFHHNVMGLSLLRGSTFPDPEADQGRHRFTYSLLPHPGSWREAEVVRRAYELNVPLDAVGITVPHHQPTPYSFLSTIAKNIIIETVKVAADGDGLIIRFYEAANQRGPVRLQFGLPIRAAVETDLLERELRLLPLEDGDLVVDVRPFEVKTLRIWPG